MSRKPRATVAVPRLRRPAPLSRAPRSPDRQHPPHGNLDAVLRRTPPARVAPGTGPLFWAAPFRDRFRAGGLRRGGRAGAVSFLEWNDPAGVDAGGAAAARLHPGRSGPAPGLR